MRRIGVISDIHADEAALRRALDLLVRQKADTFVCAGDVVEKGTGGDAVVRLLQSQRVPCVRGNHDRDALSNQRWLRANTGFPDHPLLLGDETLAFLEALPLTLTAELERVKVLLAHGTPTNEYVYLHPHNPRERHEQVFQSTDATVIILGAYPHSHASDIGRALDPEPWLRLRRRSRPRQLHLWPVDSTRYRMASLRP